LISIFQYSEKKKFEDLLSFNLLTGAFEKDNKQKSTEKSEKQQKN
jgi:hypothetical protein